jgi:TonB-dependent starch-binding outer membrane protein SusC
MQNRLLFCLLLSLFFSAELWAQTRTISGKIKDSETGEGIPGVNVLVKGTSTGTVSDLNGNYTLSVAEGSVLIFQAVGLATQEMRVGANSVIEVAMVSDTKQLGEVVVIGYGTQLKQDLTGSIAGVKAEDIQNIPVPSFESALQGRAAGVQITSGSGKVGQGINIRVRGSSSVTASNQPLYVVDGILVTSQSVNFNDEPTNPLADLNANDIESIDVLKDASATAIYGARAANGVVLITTKRGKTGKTTINVGYSTGFSEATRKRVFLNAREYRELFGEAYDNTDTRIKAALQAGDESYDNATNIGEWVFNEPNLAKNDFMGRLVSGWNDQTTDVNWEDIALQRGVFHQFDGSASGGNDKTKFYVGLNFLKQEGIILANAFERLSGRLNLDHKVSEKFGIGMTFNLTRTYNQRAASDSQFNNFLQLVALPAFQKPYLANGEPNQSTLYYNALLELKYATNTSTNFRNLSSFYANYQLAKGLSFRTEVGLDILSLKEETYNGPQTADNTGAAGGISTYATAQVINYSWTNTLNYTKTFNEIHTLDALLGSSFQKSESDFTNVSGRDFPGNYFKKIASATNITAGSTSLQEFSFMSYFLRLNYRFRGKYLLSLSARTDASSRFGPENRYGFFPAGSAAWILSEENFMKSINFISFLKLRLSYGLTGNAEIGNYAWRGTYSGLPYGNQSGFTPLNIATPNLKWETTAQIDLGLDFALLKDRISVTFDYYRKDTRDLLLQVQVPATSGFVNQTRNLGKLQNNGVELSITSQNTVGKLKWTTTFNIARNINKITDLNGQIIAPGNRNRVLNEAREGQPIGVFFGVKYLGVDSQTGDALYQGRDGNPTNSFSGAARQVIGDPTPDFIGGITNTLSYKGFDLNGFFQFVYGNDVYNLAGVFMSTNGNDLDNQTRDQLNRWRKPGDVSNVPQARLFEGNGTRMSSRYVQDGSYIRLKTLTLGYTIPQSILDKIKLRTARIYVTGQNLLTITKYEGWDPEVSTGFTGLSATATNPPFVDNQSSNIIQGADFYSPPQARTIIFGLNIGF